LPSALKAERFCQCFHHLTSAKFQWCFLTG